MTTYFADVKYRTRAGLCSWSGMIEATSMADALAKARNRFEARKGVVRVDAVTVRP